MTSKAEKKQIINRSAYQEYQKKQKKQAEPRFKKREKPLRFKKTEKSRPLSKAGVRSSTKEQGRRLDIFYNWAIFAVFAAIILLFVLAFVI